MAGSVPEVIRNNPEKQLATSFTDKVDGLLQRHAKLGLTAMIVNEALEYDTAAKALVKEASAKDQEIRRKIMAAVTAHDAYWKGEIIRPIEAKRSLLATRILLPWKHEQDRKAAEQAAAEALAARQAAEARRQAELAMLEAEGAQEAAQELAAQPVTVITTPIEAPKLEGATVVKKKVGKVVDARPLLAFLLGYDPEEAKRAGNARFDLINELIEWNQSGLNAAIKRGLSLPGVQVSEVEEFRNTSRG